MRRIVRVGVVVAAAGRPQLPDEELRRPVAERRVLPRLVSNLQHVPAGGQGPGQRSRRPEVHQHRLSQVGGVGPPQKDVLQLDVPMGVPAGMHPGDSLTEVIEQLQGDRLAPGRHPQGVPHPLGLLGLRQRRAPSRRTVVGVAIVVQNSLQWHEDAPIDLLPQRMWQEGEEHVAHRVVLAK